MICRRWGDRRSRHRRRARAVRIPRPAIARPHRRLEPAIGSRHVSDTDGLVAAVRSHSPGESVTVTYTRNGKTAKVTVKLSSSST